MGAPQVGDIVYRAYTLVTRFDSGTRVRLYFERYKVEKVTPKGVWLVNHYDPDVFTPRQTGLGKDGRKWMPWPGRLASATRQEALRRLLARKQAHVGHAQRRLDDAKLALMRVKVELGIEEEPVQDSPHGPFFQFT